MVTIKPGQLCFYDCYRKYINQNIAFLQNTRKNRELGMKLGHIHETIHELQLTEDDLDRLSGHVPEVLIQEQEQLRKVKPRILTMDLVDKAVTSVEKLGADHVVPYVDFPAMPCWYEFGLGDEAFSIGGGGVQYRAFFARKVKGDMIYVSMLAADYKSKDFLIDPRTGSWKYYQAGPCEDTSCPRALHSRVEAEGDISTDIVLEQWESDDIKAFCPCAYAGFHWAQIIRILNHIMRQQAPILYEEVDRREALPHPSSTGKKWEQKENARVENENNKKPNYIVVSLSKPIRYRQVHQSDPTGNHLDVTTTIPVEGYWKFLIPGPGKPWKGEDMKIIFVEGFERRGVPSEGRTRLVITP